MYTILSKEMTSQELLLCYKILPKILEKDLSVGTYEVNDVLYFKIEDEVLKNYKDVEVEVHHKYHDIFLMIEGTEVYFLQSDAIVADDFFDEEKDVGFGKKELSKIKIGLITDRQGIHIAPNQWHASQMGLDEKNKKLVIKIQDKSFWEKGMTINKVKGDLEIFIKNLDKSQESSAEDVPEATDDLAEASLF